MGANWFDRILLSVAPKRAAERAYYREVARGYYAAAEIGRRHEGWTAANPTGELAGRAARDIVRARARDRERNDDMYKAVVRDLERNVSGVGMMLQARVRREDGKEDEPLNSQIERLWRRWCEPERCTVSHDRSFGEVQRLAVRRMYVDGGLLVLKCYLGGELRLQLLEVDDLDSAVLMHGENRVVGGIEIDACNRPVAYHLRQQDVNGMWLGKVLRVDASRVIYLSSRDRVSQIREVSPSASSLTRVDAIDQLLEAAIKKEQVQACFGAAVTSDGGVSGLGRGLGSSGGGQGDAPYPVEYLAPGMIKHLRPGEKIESIAPSGMSSTADGMIRLIQRQAGAGAGLSYEAVSRDMSQVNYSSARQGMLQDRKTYAEWQTYLTEHLLRPVYAEWLRWSVLTGQLELPGYDLDPERYQEAVWIAPGQEWIDPKKEADANKVALDTHQTTLQRICAARGDDWRDVIRQRAKEKALIAQLLGVPAVDAAPSGNPGGTVEEDDNDEKEDE